MNKRRRRRRRLEDLELVAFNLDHGTAVITDAEGEVFTGSITHWFDLDEEETDDPEECAVIVCEFEIEGRVYVPAFNISEMNMTVH